MTGWTCFRTQRWMCEFKSASGQSALVVPRGAVSIEGDKRFVFRVENNRLHRVADQSGHRESDQDRSAFRPERGRCGGAAGRRLAERRFEHHTGAPGMIRRFLFAAAVIVLACGWERRWPFGGTIFYARRAARLQRRTLQPRRGCAEQPPSQNLRMTPPCIFCWGKVITSCAISRAPWPAWSAPCSWLPKNSEYHDWLGKVLRAQGRGNHVFQAR